MRRAIACARLCARLKHWRRAKKARLVWLRRLQDVRQITRLKQRSLSFTFCKTQRSYEKITCIYLIFHWFSGENCIIRSSDRRCSIAQVFSCEFCKISKNNFFTEHLRTNRDFNTCISLWIFQNFLNSFFYRKIRWLLLNYVIVSERMFNKKN